MRGVRIMVAALLMGAALAQARADTAAAFEAGKSFSGAVDPAAAAKGGGNFTLGGKSYGIGDITAMSQARGGGPDLANPPEVGIDSATLENPADAYATSAEAQWASSSANSRPVFNIDPVNDPLLQQGNAIKENPEAVVGSLDESYSECHTISVDGAATYEERICQESRVATTVTCQKTLSIICDPLRDGCDAGHIVPSTADGDMFTTWAADGIGNYNFKFGNINFVSGWGTGIYDRDLTIDIDSVANVTQFVLTRITYDDYLLVSVNGSVVYAGPFQTLWNGGFRFPPWGLGLTSLPTPDRLEITAPLSLIQGVDYCTETRSGYSCYSAPDYRDNRILIGTYGYCQYAPNALTDGGEWYCGDREPNHIRFCATCFTGYNDFHTVWNDTPNIDIRPYLRDGTNTISTRTIVAGGGGVLLYARTRQTCPRTCSDSWDDQCAPYRALVR